MQFKLFLFFIVYFCAFGQNDTIRQNNDILVGEIKSLSTF
jgi:hypothetical protein